VALKRDVRYTSAAQVAQEAQQQADRAFLERIYGAHGTGHVETFSSSWHFTPQDHARAVRIVTAHPAVTPFLQGRWSVLGADQVWQRGSGSSHGQTIHVHIFDYTGNRLIDVRVENDQVTSVDERGLHEYPESPHEMATAIDLARSHPDLRDAVRDLDGHAILRVSADRRHPSVMRRCMWVMFTDHDDPTRELLTQYVALVDIGAMEVIAWSPTPAPSRVDDGHTEAQS
jgi:hypothetical protein